MADRLITDVGGLPAGPVPRAEVNQLFWEKQMIAMFNVLWTKGIINLDEFRRTVEQMSPDEYKKSTFYGRRLDGVAALLIEKGHITRDELTRRTEDVLKRGREEMRRGDAAQVTADTLGNA